MVCRYLQIPHRVYVSTGGHPKHTKTNSEAMPSTTYRMILTFREYAMTKRPLWIKSDSSKSLRLWVVLATISRDAHEFVLAYEQCQKAGMAISRRNEMPQQLILFCEILYVWDIDFMGPFPVSYENSYILLVVDYVSRWMEAKAAKTNEAKSVDQ
ncbi:hypothetical protein CR513_38398, partial [Mucuna pruriens]